MAFNQQFWREQEEQFGRKLADFERCLETPFIPGELNEWFADTRPAYEELKPLVQLQIQYLHTEEFAEITEEDPELFGRVDEMKEEDENLAALLENFEDDLDRLSGEAEAGATETDLKEDLDEFVAGGLDFVTRLRKQKVAVETWLTEAFTRDRGIVD
jgi:hypothetical protein